MERKLSSKKKIWRSAIVFLGLISFFVVLFVILIQTGFWEKMNSVEKLRGLFQDLGFWGRLTFVVLQFLQVTFIPIPSTILTIAGAVVFGPLQGALLSLAGLFLGSAVAFFLGQTCGKKLVCFMVGEETCQKWTEHLTKAKYSFVLMMLFPLFPDDVLCLVAGLTNMSWNFFALTNFLTRPIGVFLTCYLGSGDFIPYSGWGLFVWPVLIIVVLVMIFLATKYQSKIESFVMKLKNKKQA